MKSEVTRVTERGQVSIPASIRKRMRLAPGQRICWELLSGQACRITAVKESDARLGAAAMRGFAKTFRKARSTAAWMRELRAGEVA